MVVVSSKEENEKWNRKEDWGKIVREDAKVKEGAEEEGDQEEEDQKVGRWFCRMLAITLTSAWIPYLTSCLFPSVFPCLNFFVFLLIFPFYRQKGIDWWRVEARWNSVFIDCNSRNWSNKVTSSNRRHSHTLRISPLSLTLTPKVMRKQERNGTVRRGS